MLSEAFWTPNIASSYFAGYFQLGSRTNIRRIKNGLNAFQLGQTGSPAAWVVQGELWKELYFSKDAFVRKNNSKKQTKTNKQATTKNTNKNCFVQHIDELKTETLTRRFCITPCWSSLMPTAHLHCTGKHCIKAPRWFRFLVQHPPFGGGTGCGKRHHGSQLSPRPLWSRFLAG